jgi:hypothetical protein
LKCGGVEEKAEYLWVKMGFFGRVDVPRMLSWPARGFSVDRSDQDPELHLRSMLPTICNRNEPLNNPERALSSSNNGPFLSTIARMVAHLDIARVEEPAEVLMESFSSRT